VTQTFEGVGLTKQKAKMAAAERALRRGFVQFRNVDPVNHILQRTCDRDAMNQHDDVIDFSSDESSTSQSTSIVMLFTDLPVSSQASSPLEEVTSSAADAENQEATMSSSG